MVLNQFDDFIFKKNTCLGGFRSCDDWDVGSENILEKGLKVF